MRSLLLLVGLPFFPEGAHASERSQAQPIPNPTSSRPEKEETLTNEVRHDDEARDDNDQDEQHGDDDEEHDDHRPSEDTIHFRLGAELAWMQHGLTYHIEYQTTAQQADLHGDRGDRDALLRGGRLEVGRVFSRWSGSFALVPKGTLSVGALGKTTLRDSALGQDYAFEARYSAVSVGAGLELQLLGRHLLLSPEVGYFGTLGSARSMAPRGARASIGEDGVFARQHIGFRANVSRHFILGAFASGGVFVAYAIGIEGIYPTSGGTLFLEWDPFGPNKEQR